MRQRRYGRLICIGSIFGLEPEPSSIVQSTARTGLNAFSKCLGTEAAADGVPPNIICPGYFDTPLVTSLAAQYADKAGVPVAQIFDDWKNFTPCKKFGRPEDLGAFVSLLNSPSGEFFNGTSIVIDGGAIRQYQERVTKISSSRGQAKECGARMQAQKLRRRAGGGTFNTLWAEDAAPRPCSSPQQRRFLLLGLRKLCNTP